MQKKLTITIDERSVYDGLHAIVGRRGRLATL